LEKVIESVGPGGHFIEDRSTVAGIRSGEWYVSRLGLHDTYEAWEAAGKPALLDELQDEVNRILASHEPLPLCEDVKRELDRIQAKAREIEG
jgi:trimethylamine:corrinoid methyltransferase-like protein